MRRALLTLAIGLSSFGLFAAPASADTGYIRYSTDSYSFSSSNGRAQAVGTVKWYKAARTLLPDVYRGEYTGGVTLTRTGCLYAKIRWIKVTGTVSWPPSGGTSTTSDGYYKRCGAAGTKLSLTGQAYASTTLIRTCLDIGYSSSAANPRSYQATHCMFN